MISHKLLGADEYFVLCHRDCGLELFTDDIIFGLLEQSLDTRSIDAEGWHDAPTSADGSPAGRYVKWLTIANPQ